MLIPLPKEWVAHCLTSEHLIWVIFELLQALLLVSSQSYDCLAPHAQLPLRNCMHTHLEPGRANLCHIQMATLAVCCTCMSQTRHTLHTSLRQRYRAQEAHDGALSVAGNGGLDETAACMHQLGT